MVLPQTVTGGPLAGSRSKLTGSWPQPAMALGGAATALYLLLIAQTAAAAAVVPAAAAACKPPSRADPIVALSPLLGQPNATDTIAFGSSWAFKQHGPISQLTLFKAWYYDGAWHDPGELKGVQLWFGRRRFTHNDKLLFGAKRPHVPKNCTFAPDEVLVRAEVQWDHILRWMNLTSNRGRYCAWGFHNVAGASSAVVTPPVPGGYIAALRGFEGKPLPKELGGHKDRYIDQVGFAWAQRDCGQSRLPALRGAPPQPPATTQRRPAAKSGGGAGGASRWE